MDATRLCEAGHDMIGKENEANGSKIIQKAVEGTSMEKKTKESNYMNSGKTQKRKESTEMRDLPGEDTESWQRTQQCKT
jgi:hypothetical protein